MGNSVQQLKRLLWITLLICAPMASGEEAQLWTQWLSQVKLGPSLRVWAEVQPRYGVSTNGLTTILTRPGVGWQVTPELSLWLGYAWTPLIRPSARDEHRLWAQGILTLNADNLRITQRLRVEARSIERSSPAGHRLRYQVRGSIPFAQDYPLSAVIYDEVFLAFNNALPAAVSGFDQNRLFMGINYRISSDLNADLGYLWNAIHSPPPQAPRSNHVVMITFLHALDLN